jgi:DNA primase
MVSAYSVRPSPGAPVSMPIEWDEVNAKLHNSNWTIKNARKRLEKLGYDPCIKVLEVKPKLMSVLERLTRSLATDVARFLYVFAHGAGGHESPVHAARG